MGDKSLRDILNISREPDAIHFFLDKRHIVTYSEQMAAFPGKDVDMGRYHFPGFAYLDTKFFHKLDTEKHPGSDMVNLAKAFFQFNEKNHVCLVQFLPEDGLSGEHYHTLDEYIACTAGAATVRMSPPENDTDEKRMPLKQGDILHIPPRTLHVLYSQEGCITIPIKQTIEGKRDHIYQDKSEKRMLKEFDSMVRGVHHESGTEMASELIHYYSYLKPGEKIVFQGIIENKLAAEKNENIICILGEVKKDIQSS